MTAEKMEVTNEVIGKSRASVPLDIDFGNEWDTVALRELINERIAADRSPSWLFLGKHEALLLRAHLVGAFGFEQVQTLHRLYYMGLEVIELEAPRFCRVAGRKFIGKLKKADADLRKWRENDFSAWSFRFE